MIIKKTGVWLCAFTLQVSMASVIAEEFDEAKQRSWYLGAGLGVTELDPDTNNTGYNVSDERDTGFKLFGGFDFSERLTVEGFYTDLGAAQISSPLPSQPDGAIDYSTLGGSALWYFWRNAESKGSNLRKGLQAYAHGGLSFINNSSSVNYDKNNSFQIQYGAALEYGLNDGVALRAGIDLYDKDAGMVFVGVLKRFGTKSKRKVIAEPVPEPVIEVAPEPEVIVPVVVVIQDADNDGVIDADDQCADTPANITVNDKGCSNIFVEIEGVNFEPNSFELTEQSKVILDEAIVTISASPELHIEVQAHTDYKGSGEANLELSEQRALSVKAYLVSKGVNENQLTAKGYGESMPIADNKTAEGRARNRRVELVVIKDEAKGLDVEKLDLIDAAEPENGSAEPADESVPATEAPTVESTKPDVEQKDSTNAAEPDEAQTESVDTTKTVEESPNSGEVGETDKTDLMQ